MEQRGSKEVWNLCSRPLVHAFELAVVDGYSWPPPFFYASELVENIAGFY